LKDCLRKRREPEHLLADANSPNELWRCESSTSGSHHFLEHLPKQFLVLFRDGLGLTGGEGCITIIMDIDMVEQAWSLGPSIGTDLRDRTPLHLAGGPVGKKGLRILSPAVMALSVVCVGTTEFGVGVWTGIQVRIEVVPWPWTGRGCVSMGWIGARLFSLLCEGHGGESLESRRKEGRTGQFNRGYQLDSPGC